MERAIRIQLPAVLADIDETVDGEPGHPSPVLVFDIGCDICRITVPWQVAIAARLEVGAPVEVELRLRTQAKMGGTGCAVPQSPALATNLDGSRSSVVGHLEHASRDFWVTRKPLFGRKQFEEGAKVPVVQPVVLVALAQRFCPLA